MTFPFVLAVCGATLGGFFVLLSLSFATAPGWHGLRWFAVIAGTAGCFCASIAVAISTTDDGTVTALARVCFSLAAINSLAWVRYSATHPPRGLERALEGLALAAAALGLVPGVFFGSDVVRNGHGWWHSDYVIVLPTPLGVVAFAVIFGVVLVPFGRYWARWRAGESGAGAHVLALGALGVTGALDVIDCAWVRAWPRLAPLGFIFTVAAVGWTLARRFVASACELEALSTRLDAIVVERTSELASAQASLAQHEKFAVLGRLSGAVAHEINNPAAAVAANLGYMRDVLTRDGTAPEGFAEVIRETLESVDRIAGIVQRLGDAGELAIRGAPSSPVSVAETVRHAATDAHADLGSGVALAFDVPEDLYVSTQEASLKQVVTGLIVIAARAMRAAQCSGRIVVEATRRDDRVVLRVSDPCPEVDGAHRFEPFLSARPTAMARGVGLSVSVVLLRVFGGELALERADGAGSVVRIELHAVETPAPTAEVADSSRSARVRVLFVDDEELVRVGFRRLLGREYVFEEASSVEEALALLRTDGDHIDAIVCDLVMPDGGAGRLLEEVKRLAPPLALATVLITGGAVDEETRAVLDANEGRVLRKPVDVRSLRKLIEQVRRRRPPVAKPESA
jgi:signal transduction histidine kinase/ActR/RegA family two-component response regulator